jgi:hypothetical protein
MHRICDTYCFYTAAVAVSCPAILTVAKQPFIVMYDARCERVVLLASHHRKLHTHPHTVTTSALREKSSAPLFQAPSRGLLDRNVLLKQLQPFVKLRDA